MSWERVHVERLSKLQVQVQNLIEDISDEKQTHELLSINERMAGEGARRLKKIEADEKGEPEKRSELDDRPPSSLFVDALVPYIEGSKDHA